MYYNKFCLDITHNPDYIFKLNFNYYLTEAIPTLPGHTIGLSHLVSSLKFAHVLDPLNRFITLRCTNRSRIWNVLYKGRKVMSFKTYCNTFSIGTFKNLPVHTWYIQSAFLPCITNLVPKYTFETLSISCFYFPSAQEQVLLFVQIHVTHHNKNLLSTSKGALLVSSIQHPVGPPVEQKAQNTTG